MAVAAASAIVAVAAMLVPGSASAASPVLELVAPGRSLPVSFTTEGGPVVAELAGFERVVHCSGSAGEGEITAPRSAVSKYTFTGCVARGTKSETACKSEGANPEEIKTGPIAAELVYLDRALNEVGILLNPGGGIYMTFECGGELTEARGPFLSSVTPLNKEDSTFTTTLAQSSGLQTLDEYETFSGEKGKATPEGKRGSHEWTTTGVATTITVHTSVPVEIEALTAGEVEAKQHEETTQREQLEREALAAATAKKHQEETVAKKHQEEELAAIKKRAEEAMAALEAAISGALTENGKPTPIGVLLKHGGVTLSFSSSEPGTLIIQWWQLPPGAHLSKAGRLKPVLVAQGRAAFSAAGVGNVKVRLTRAGRRLLARAAKLKLTTQVRFTPAAAPAISATRTQVLKR